MDFCIGAGNSNPSLDKEIRALDSLAGQERGDQGRFRVDKVLFSRETPLKV
jgi:hypothetical protein